MGDLLKFFKSKNVDRKFAKLGEGHRLSDASVGHSGTSVSKNKKEFTSSLRSASSSGSAEAAMSRLSISRPQNTCVHTETSTQGGENLWHQSVEVEPTQQHIVNAEKPAVISKLLFWCPKLFGDAVIGSRDEVEQAIHNYLLSESSFNASEAVVLMLIRGLERSKPPSSSNISISIREIRENRKQNIIRILQNLIRSPENLVYRRLRASNKLIQDLLSVDGVEQFLTACNFKKQLLPITHPTEPNQSNGDSVIQSTEEIAENEVFYVVSEEDAQDREYLEKLLNLLMTADSIFPELYRDTKVFRATGRAVSCVSRDHLPDDFFILTKEELRKCIDQQRQIIEESGMLLTKAMRERLKTQGMKSFRYAVIRVRFPDNLILQVSLFYAVDTLLSVRQWVSECLAEPLSFRLYSPPSLEIAARLKAPPTTYIELTDDNASVAELGLAPSSLINLIFEDGQKLNSSSPLRRDLSKFIEIL
ncbi:unnamed protein product [Heterobilharzia americana]|nr:unnamed protein product [Heterobilharzia americana]